MNDPLTLRYFDARGRVQFIRYYLRVRNIEFIDERIPIEPDFSSWMKVRDDASLTGPFHKLPVLEVDGELIAETPVITGYLHKRFGDAELLDAELERQHQQLLSALNDDVTMALGQLLWGEVLCAGLDFPAYVRRIFDRLTRNLQSIEAALVQWQWLENMNLRPIMLADCRLWESADVCRTVFGAHLNSASLPTLDRIHDRYSSGTAFSELLEESPCPITARDNESEVIERIQSILAG